MRTWLAEMRNKKGLTQEEVANLCGIARTTYAMIEQEHRKPSVNVAKKIAAAFNFNWTIFFENECHVSCISEQSATREVS